VKVKKYKEGLRTFKRYRLGLRFYKRQFVIQVPIYFNLNFEQNFKTKKPWRLFKVTRPLFFKQAAVFNQYWFAISSETVRVRCFEFLINNRHTKIATSKNINLEVFIGHEVSFCWQKRGVFHYSFFTLPIGKNCGFQKIRRSEDIMTTNKNSHLELHLRSRSDFMSKKNSFGVLICQRSVKRNLSVHIYSEARKDVWNTFLIS